VGRRHATALVQAGSQVPAAGMFGHLVQTATLPGPGNYYGAAKEGGLLGA